MSEDNKFHPSFVPLIEKINERGYRSPYAYVSFDTKEGHVHHVPIGNGTDNLIAMGDSVEDVASFLIDAIAACHPDKHNGHGTTHDTSQFKKAYASAITQLLNTDYDTEYAHQVWLEKMYRKWGGHIPAAVLMPIEDDVSAQQEGSGHPPHLPCRIVDADPLCAGLGPASPTLEDLAGQLR